MKKIEFIGMPIKYGCYVDGADLAFSKLKPMIENTFNTKCSEIDTSYNNPIEHLNDKKLRYVEPVMELSKRLYDKVYKCLDNSIPIVIGGDHSTCIGSISAVLDYYKKDMSVIYIDEHADIHNHITTPSGNIHGMPLSICIGRCDSRFDIGNYKLKPSNLHYIGLCNYEIEEIDYIKSENINCYMDIDEKKANFIVEDLLKKVTTKNIHISFDLDCIKSDEFPAVNVAVQNIYHDDNGLSLATVKQIIKLLLNNFNVCSIDIVEYNPTLDKDNKCMYIIKELLCIINDNLEVLHD